MPTDAAGQFWQSLGDENPYWGVLTADTFRADNLTDSAVEAFYAGGEEHVSFVLDTVRTHIDPEFAPDSAIDFGCGVGRLVVPLARRCGAVVGIDVADGMLRRARARCDRLGLSNVRLLTDVDHLPEAEGFDLVHSYIVFQHIPCAKGEAIAEQLLGRLADGGVGVLHFTYFKEPRSRRPRLRRFLERWRLYRLARGVRGLARGAAEWVTGRTWDEPEMQMNSYNLNAILLTLQRAGVRRLHLEYTDHGGCYGVMLFFQKCAADRYMV
jgi:SAM-dependent methyltransferase